MLTGPSLPDPGRLLEAVDISGRKHVIIAVSGGGDSLALLLLVNDALRKQRGNAPSLLAVTVDHALRTESAQEAQMVADLCAEHGISHRIMRWEGAKPSTGISEAAREARFHLLAQAAKDAGTDLVLTGHTADDQAETLAMRMKRASGRGLAGIAAATLFEGRIWFVRPLLEARRAVLREFLRLRNVTWIEDPTNRDPRFERARLRRTLREIDIPRLLEEAEQASSERERDGSAAAALISRHVNLAEPGLIRIDAAFAEAGSTARYAFRILLAVAGGTSHLPAEDRAATLLSRSLQGDLGANLSRAMIVRRRQHIYLYREQRNLPTAPLADGVTWDGRYRIQWKGARQDLTVAPLGTRQATTFEPGLEPPADLSRSALAAQPAVWSGDKCLGAELPGLSLVPLAGPWAQLLPCFDLVPARTVTDMLHGEPIPNSPWVGHKKSTG